ncbi:T9SS type A sorting domain-containing protein [Pontibacter sp. KCTC 32443]|uniref:T9SS type A sorting domain-containing protein n=1 Tax=Pontibacter TaxID=323449 RepID=UPI00164E3A00|nr:MULTISPECIES: T9SS type A sorting domain-containing protein [Pontibacter]MBC5772946.1 T9SS type A sorting domain-containing protein [Pontibacter sp. KCTC 32443]
MNTPILQHLLKLIISLILSLLPILTLMAQQKTEKKDNTVRVKMFKSVDGKFVYSKDTVINAADHEAQIAALKNLKFDEKTWTKLEASKIVIDSIKGLHMFRTPMAFKVLQDTAMMHRLKDAKVYKFERKLDGEKGAILFETLKGAKGDSFMLKAMKGDKFILHADSLLGTRFKTMNIDADGKAIHILQAGSDSSHVIVRVMGKDGMIIRNGDMVHAGDFSTRYATSDKIKIETDESGKTTVYEIDEKGSKKEIDAYHFGRSGQKSTVILLNRTKVEDITKEDKKALKEAGIKVEKSAKKELKIENLSYYPNPSSGRFNVSFTLPDKEPATLRVLNSVGKQVYQEQITKPATLFEKQIDISSYGKGIYYLQVEQGGRTLTKRLLVQ